MARFSPLRVIFVTLSWCCMALAAGSFVIDVPPLHPAWFYLGMACFIAEMTRQTRTIMILLAAFCSFGIAALHFNVSHWHYGNWFAGPIFMGVVFTVVLLLIGILSRDPREAERMQPGDEDIIFAEYGPQVRL